MSTARSQPHIFASQRWITIQFEKIPKNPIDHLIDILLSSPIYLTAGDKASKQTNHELDRSKCKLYTDVPRFISELEVWWLRYVSNVHHRGCTEGSCWVISPNEMTAASCMDADAYLRGSYCKTPIAAFIALYHAASMIAFSRLSLISPPTDLCEHRIKAHARK